MIFTKMSTYRIVSKTPFSKIEFTNKHSETQSFQVGLVINPFTDHCVIENPESEETKSHPLPFLDPTQVTLEPNEQVSVTWSNVDPYLDSRFFSVEVSTKGPLVDLESNFVIANPNNRFVINEYSYYVILVSEVSSILQIVPSGVFRTHYTNDINRVHMATSTKRQQNQFSLQQNLKLDIDLKLKIHSCNPRILRVDCSDFSSYLSNLGLEHHDMFIRNPLTNSRELVTFRKDPEFETWISQTIRTLIPDSMKVSYLLQNPLWTLSDRRLVTQPDTVKGFFIINTNDTQSHLWVDFPSVNVRVSLKQGHAVFCHRSVPYSIRGYIENAFTCLLFVMIQ